MIDIFLQWFTSDSTSKTIAEQFAKKKPYFHYYLTLPDFENIKFHCIHIKIFFYMNNIKIYYNSKLKKDIIWKKLICHGIIDPQSSD